jgi:hypothetical protein
VRRVLAEKCMNGPDHVGTFFFDVVQRMDSLALWTFHETFRLGVVSGGRVGPTEES